MSTRAESATAGFLMPSIDSSTGMRLLPLVLSVIAGATDVISFLGLGGLFAAHVTGNLIVLAAHVVNGEPAPVAHTLSIPVFALVLGAGRLLAAGIEAKGIASLAPLLLLQFLLLAVCLWLGVTVAAPLDPHAMTAITAGMFGVAAISVQNLLVRVSLRDAPATAIMTTNVTLLTIDLCNLFVARNREDAARSRSRAGRTWPAVVGFLLGCGAGAWVEAAFGLWGFALPAALSLLALGLSLPTIPNVGRSSA